MVSAQEKKTDSADINRLFEYKAKIFYPVDCSCPGKVIYKEAKPGDKNVNPYNYKEIKPIRIDSLPKEDKSIFSNRFIKKHKNPAD